MCLNFIKLVGSKERLQKKNEHCIFKLFKPYQEPDENVARISVSALNGEWMPEGSEAESKNNVPLQFLSCHPMTMLVAELFGPGPAVTGKNRMKVPTCYISKVLANVNLQDGILKGKVFGLGFGYFSSPAFRTLLGKLIPDSSLWSFIMETNF